MKIGQNFPQILTHKGVRGSYVTSRSVTTTETDLTLFNFRYIFSGTSGIKEKALQPLLAYYLLSGTVQFVWRSAVTRRLVIK